MSKREESDCVQVFQFDSQLPLKCMEIEHL